MANRILDKVKTVLEIQNTPGGSARSILDVSQGIKPMLGDFTKSFGAITRKYRLDPVTNAPLPRPVLRDMPEPITAELSMLLTAFNYMEQFDEDSRFTLYVRYPVSHASNFLDYDRIDILTDCALESITVPQPVADEPNTDDTKITVPINAATHILINKVEGSRIVTGFTLSNDTHSLLAAVDDDDVIYAVTAADGVGLKPFLQRSANKGATWTEVELADLSASASGLCVAGDYLVIAAGTEIGVHNKVTGAQVSTFTAAQAINALAAIDAANIIAAGAAGYLAMSSDGGLTWTTLVSGVATALNVIGVRNINEWFVGGASGVLRRYDNGVISGVTLPGALAAATIKTIAFPFAPAGFNRENTIYIGANNGTAYKSDSNGATGTWVQYEYPDDGSGECTKLMFTGFMGQVLYILHKTPGGASLVKRDWSGGVGGTTNVEAVTVPTNSGLNDLVILDPNLAVAVGQIHSAADMIVRIARS